MGTESQNDHNVIKRISTICFDRQDEFPTHKLWDFTGMEKGGSQRFLLHILYMCTNGHIDSGKRKSGHMEFGNFLSMYLKLDKLDKTCAA